MAFSVNNIRVQFIQLFEKKKIIDLSFVFYIKCHIIGIISLHTPFIATRILFKTERKTKTCISIKSSLAHSLTPFV